jgi:hypothetical protein
MRSIARSLIALTALALLPVISIAQEGPDVILKIGAVSAKQDYTHDFPFYEVRDTEYRWGLAVGGEVRFLRAAGVDFLAELLYVEKGYGAEFLVSTAGFPEGIGTLITYPLRLKYLSLTGSAKVRPFSGPIAPFFRLGPRADIFLHAESLRNTSAVDLGVTIGVGAEVSLGPLPILLLEGRFSPDFTDASGSSSLGARNRSFELLAGIGF